MDKLIKIAYLIAILFFLGIYGYAYYYKDIEIKVVERIEFLSEYERKRSMKLETLLLRDFFKDGAKI